jgi:ubiquinone/menaquinone biosynthesis C-methylase UbiE
LNILNPNVRKTLINKVSEPYVLSENGSQIVYEYNRSLPNSYFEHLEFPVNSFWFDYFSSKMNFAFGTSKQKALDVCAGTGTLSLNLMVKGYFEKCVAIDISEVAIFRLKKRITEYNLDEVMDAKCENIMDTTFNDNEFDCIAGNSFLHHLPNNRLFLREMHRILTPGGSICFTGEPTVSCSALEGLILGNLIKLLKFLKLKKSTAVPSMSDIWSYDINSLKKLLEEEGFKEIKIIPFGFLVAIFNEPTSFIMSKIIGRSMQPIWYWNFFGKIDKLFFSWIPANYHSHFIITGKK